MSIRYDIAEAIHMAECEGSPEECIDHDLRTADGVLKVITPLVAPVREWYDSASDTELLGSMSLSKVVVPLLNALLVENA